MNLDTLANSILAGDTDPAQWDATVIRMNVRRFAASWLDVRERAAYTISGHRFDPSLPPHSPHAAMMLSLIRLADFFDTVFHHTGLSDYVLPRDGTAMQRLLSGGPEARRVRCHVLLAVQMALDPDVGRGDPPTIESILNAIAPALQNSMTADTMHRLWEHVKRSMPDRLPELATIIENDLLPLLD